MSDQILAKLYECGCILPTKTVNGKPNRFIFNHNKKNENNGQWKGEDVGYFGVHTWVRRHLLKPKQCQECNEVKRLYLACVTGKYTRDFSNYKYLCCKCHWKIDRLIDMSNRICSVCKSDKTCTQSNGRPHWYYSKVTGKYLCRKCGKEEHRRE